MAKPKRKQRPPTVQKLKEIAEYQDGGIYLRKVSSQWELVEVPAAPDTRSWPERLANWLLEITTAATRSRHSDDSFVRDTAEYALVLAEALKGVIDTGGPPELVAHLALDLGGIAERLNVLPHEPAALKGKKQAQRGRALSQTRVLLTLEQQREAAAEIAALIAQGMDFEPACKSLVKKYGVSYKTLQRYYKKRTPV